MTRIRGRATESWCIASAVFMKARGKTTFATAKDTKNIVTETLTKATLSLVKLTVKESIIGPTVKSTTVNGAAALKKVMVCGKASTVTVTWVSGANLKPMVTVFISGRTAIATKAAGISVSNKEKEVISLLTVTPTQVNTNTGVRTERESTNGLMVASTVASSKRA